MSDSRSRHAFAPVLFGVIAVASLFALDRAGAAVVRTILSHSDDRVARIYAGERTDDVVILGNSVGNAMANPVDLSNRTGRSVFMMAMHGLDALTQEAMARDYLTLNTRPRLALIEIRSARGGTVRAHDFAPYVGPGTYMSALLDQTHDSILPWRDIFHVYRLNSPRLPKTVQNLVDRDDQATGASDGHITPAIIKAWNAGFQSEGVEPERAKAFAATINAFRAAGTIPVVILAPVHPSGRNRTQLVRSDVLPNVPSGILVCDFSDYLSEDRYFEDPVHLNRAGRDAIAPLFTALFASKLDLGTPADSSAAAPTLAERCRTSSGGRAPA